MFRLALAALCALVLAITPARAQTQQTASAPPILKIIRLGAAPIEFSRAALESLPQRKMSTATPWTRGATTFEGPLLRDLLAHAGAQGSTVSAVAINDYKVTFPVADAQTYDVIVAIRRDGQYMPLRDKGPLWIIYPLDSVAELRNPETHSKMIWQLKTLSVD